MGFGFAIGRGARRLSSTWLAAAVLALVLLVARPALAQDTLRGVALVIGNGAYEHLAPLTNPERDARAIEALLSDLGFDTNLTSDRDARRLARDLRDFVDDAEGADVAVLYYAGHGIEAGGENWLVPVDADLAALGDADGKLVPLSRIVAELQATVGVTIVLLDACRDNPFPPGATLTLPSGDAAAITAGGLAIGDTRGASRMGQASAPAIDSLGTVIGFAAEPGKVALDGAPGENSPYAAALVRHLAALAGAEFGQVMRMIGEEVYLKTGGRQRPWVNESLRRLLYFGEAPDMPAGAERDILTERRQLLLTIAALPDLERGSVERAAAEGGVPMDALYGMLRALGQEVPRDPRQLEELLRAQSESLRGLMQERAALKSADPEIQRLAALSQQAIGEGALETAIRLLADAKARIGEIETTVAAAESDALARRIEFAEVYARSAEANSLAFDMLAAAADYARAFEQVDRRDDRLAWTYKVAVADAYVDHGRFKGDRAAMEAGVAAAREALRLAMFLDDAAMVLNSRAGLGMALRVLGERDDDPTTLREAAEMLSAALGDEARALDPAGWAEGRQVLGEVYARLGERGTGTEALYHALSMIESALEIRTREADLAGWARTRQVQASVLSMIGLRETGGRRLEEAAAITEEVLGAISRERLPVLWVQLKNAQAVIHASLAEQRNSVAESIRAIESLREMVAAIPVDRVPDEWAAAHANLGAMLMRLGEITGETAWLVESAQVLGRALEYDSRERDPVGWAITVNTLGGVLLRLGEHTGDVELIRAGVERFRQALEVRTLERLPNDWVQSRLNLGLALTSIGRETRDTQALREALAVQRETLSVLSREASPLDWATARYQNGRALDSLFQLEKDADAGREAIAEFRLALSETDPQRHAYRWYYAHRDMGQVMLELGDAQNDRPLLEDAVATFRAAYGSAHAAAHADLRAHSARLLAKALNRRAVLANDIAGFREAVPLYEIALPFFDPGRYLGEWANIANEFAGVLAEIGIADRDMAPVRRGRDLVAAIRDALRAGGNEQHLAYLEQRLATFDNLLQQMQAQLSR